MNSFTDISKYKPYFGEPAFGLVIKPSELGRFFDMRKVRKDAIISEMIGVRYHSLVVIKMEYIKNCVPYFLCQCDCGNTCIKKGAYLRSGHTKSCGCRKHEMCGSTSITFGVSKTPLYRIWLGMIARCYNHKNNAYHNYGGRGITVCDEWLINPTVFIEWAKNNGYKKGLTIDRIDVDGIYSPNNCRFCDYKTQCNNKRNTIFLECGGERLPLQIISEKYGVPPKTVHQRIRKLGWDDCKALLTLVKKQK